MSTIAYQLDFALLPVGIYGTRLEKERKHTTLRQQRAICLFLGWVLRHVSRNWCFACCTEVPVHLPLLEASLVATGLPSIGILQ